MDNEADLTYKWHKEACDIMNSHTADTVGDALVDLGTLRAVLHGMCCAVSDIEVHLSGDFNSKLLNSLLNHFASGIEKGVSIGKMIGIMELIIFEETAHISETMRGSGGSASPGSTLH